MILFPCYILPRTYYVSVNALERKTQVVRRPPLTGRSVRQHRLTTERTPGLLDLAQVSTFHVPQQVGDAERKDPGAALPSTSGVVEYLPGLRVRLSTEQSLMAKLCPRETYFITALCRLDFTLVVSFQMLS